MKLSTRGRYAVRALVDLALHMNDSSILIRDVAERQGISVRYLQHLLTPLIKAGIVKSMRGAGGGIALARSQEEIKLGEIMYILEGSFAPTECVNDPEVCERSAYCATRDIWAELKNAIEGVMYSTTIMQIADRQRRKEQVSGIMYHI